MLKKIAGSQSLFELNGGSRVYVRYSKLHGGNRTFYGLRKEDLSELAGHRSTICFLWDEQTVPLVLPFEEYEHLFESITPAQDGQYKAQIQLRAEGTELYLARAGRFNVDGFFGWEGLDELVSSDHLIIPMLNHSQMQTLIESIGIQKGFEVWVPQNNRAGLDWNVAGRFRCCDVLPPKLSVIQSVTQEVDVIWLKRGSSEIRAMFEVEHSTSIYSGLLRFNDVHLTAPKLVDRFHIVANDERRDRFARQLARPTFQLSGLSEHCTFLRYEDVYRWFRKLRFA